MRECPALLEALAACPELRGRRQCPPSYQTHGGPRARPRRSVEAFGPHSRRCSGVAYDVWSGTGWRKLRPPAAAAPGLVCKSRRKLVPCFPGPWKDPAVWKCPLQWKHPDVWGHPRVDAAREGVLPEKSFDMRASRPIRKVAKWIQKGAKRRPKCIQDSTWAPGSILEAKKLLGW